MWVRPDAALKELPFPAKDRQRISRRRPRLLNGLSRQVSEVDFFDELNGVIHFGAEIADGAGIVRVSEQKLDRT